MSMLVRKRLGILRLAALFVALFCLPMLAGRKALAQDGNTGGNTPEGIISALTSGDVYIGPELSGQVNSIALAQAAQAARPTTVKIVAIRSDSAPWLKQYKSRDAFADDLRRHLNLSDDSVVVVGTPKGISASSGRLSPSQIKNSLSHASLDVAFTREGLTGAIVGAVEAVSGTAVSDRHSDTGRSGGILFLILGGIFGVILWKANRRKKQMEAARAPVEALRQEALKSLVYVDGYIDLLPEGDANATQARTQRQTAYDRYEMAVGILKVGKTPDEIYRAEPLLRQAISQLDQCRASIDKATGGTGVAMRLPETPSLKTDTQRAREYLDLKPIESVPNGMERDHMQRLVSHIPVEERGVSFFSGRPMPSSELIPVEIVVGGRKRTVMASRDEADAIAEGRTPPIRTFMEDGRYIPWYEYRGYDPYRDYYGGSALGTLVDLYLVTNLLGPGLWTGYGPWGYGGFGWGMPMPPPVAYGGWGGGYTPGYDGGPFYTDQDFGISGGTPVPDYAGVESEPSHAAGFDFFGGGSGGNSSEDSSQSDNSSGFDFFGGGGDSGSSDSSSFDFGGGDFGGGGDSGGGGGDW